MAAGFQGSGSENRPAQELDAASGKASSHVQLLEQVLQTTLALGEGGNEPLRPEELRTLVGIAQKRCDEPLSVETTMELVQTVLRLRYRALAESRDQWEKMTRQIAETLFDDPQTKQRLLHLWELLCGAET